MNTHVRAHIELYEPGEGGTHFRTLPLDDAQRLVLGDWLSEDLTRRLSAQAQLKDIALMRPQGHARDRGTAERAGAVTSPLRRLRMRVGGENLPAHRQTYLQ